MSEPESLATEESLAARLHRHRFDRLIMLSDGIFAISTTLAALEIRLPERRPGLVEILADAGRDVAIYFLSFAIIGALWLSNRELFARLRRVDPIVTGLTLALLCMTALIPAVTHRMRGVMDGGFEAYLLTMGVCGILNSTLWLYAASRRDLMLPEVSRADRWRRALSSVGLPLVTLPILAFSGSQAPAAMALAVGAVAVMRRVVLRRLLPGD